jgi:uncharacterized protein YoxC
MGVIDGREVNKILCRHEEILQKNNQTLYNINGKFLELEQVLTRSVPNIMELL